MNEPAAPGSSNPPAGKWRPARPERWVLLMLIGFISVSLVIWLPKDVTRWYEAAALEAELNGDLQQAERQITEAIEREPENPGLYAQRALWRAEQNNEAGAMEDCDTVLRLMPDDANGYFTRGRINFELNNHIDAASDYESVLRIFKARRAGSRELANVYNLVAYTRTIANVELEQAVQQANLAVKASGDHNEFLDALVVCVINGQWEPASSELHEAIQYIERESDRLAAPIKEEVYGLMQSAFPPTGSRDISLRRLQRDLSRIDNRLKTIRQFQSWLESRAARAPASVSEVEEFDVQVADLPGRRLATYTASAMAAVRDTRGFALLMHRRVRDAIRIVGSQLSSTDVIGGPPFELLSHAVAQPEDAVDDLSQARADLDAAAVAAEAVLHFQLSASQRHFASDMRGYNREVADRKEQLAVIRYHRALVLDAQHETQLADADRRRVRQLEFEPGPDLY